jgi:hypothetical protein
LSLHAVVLVLLLAVLECLLLRIAGGASLHLRVSPLLTTLGFSRSLWLTPLCLDACCVLAPECVAALAVLAIAVAGDVAHWLVASLRLLLTVASTQ